MTPKVLRRIPSVSDILDSPPLRPIFERISRSTVVERVRSLLDDLRAEVGGAMTEGGFPDVGELAERLARRILQSDESLPQPVINATGILLHGELGSAPLAESVGEALAAAAYDYVQMGIDPAHRQSARPAPGVERLLRELTGAEAAMVVNNREGAILLTLGALAGSKEVLVSRGQLVELGSGRCLSELIQASGAKLREVGTTNKTDLDDYQRAIQNGTAAILRVEPSDYVVLGATAQATLEDLVRIARRHNLLLIDDLGDGGIADLAQCGIDHAPNARDSISAGADLVIFSGDGLLGGPPCGILVGRRDAIQRVAEHPLGHALSLDKLRLAALSATLQLYRDPQQARLSIPLLQLLSTPVKNLQNRAERLAPQMAACGAIASAEPVADTTYLGGGAVPSRRLETWCVALTPRQGNVERLSAALRQSIPPVFARSEPQRLLLDLRSVPPRHDQGLVAAIAAIGEG